jgi:hypothetical protein
METLTMNGKERKRLTVMAGARSDEVFFSFRFWSDLLLIFLGIQGLIQWKVCLTGLNAAARLEDHDLPLLQHLATLKANLNSYQLRLFELMLRAGEILQKSSTNSKRWRET